MQPRGSLCYKKYETPLLERCAFLAFTSVIVLVLQYQQLIQVCLVTLSVDRKKQVWDFKKENEVLRLKEEGLQVYSS